MSLHPRLERLDCIEPCLSVSVNRNPSLQWLGDICTAGRQRLCAKPYLLGAKACITSVGYNFSTNLSPAPNFLPTRNLFPTQHYFQVLWPLQEEQLREGMEGVSHRTIATNGITMHITKMGSGPAVLFLHGFLEGWYSWHKQISAFARAGYRAIAPDMRGYGDTSAPEGVKNYTYLHIVGDLIGLLDALQVKKAFVVTHDWGAIIGWQMSLFRPDRVIALASLSVYFIPRHPAGSIVQLQRAVHGEEHYMCKFQVPGQAEAQIASLSSEMFLRYVFAGKFNQNVDILDGSKEKLPLPALPEWMSEDDLAYYISEFEKHGFTPALNYYRALDLSWELTAAWQGSKVMVPAVFIIGDQDMVYEFHGAKDYIHGGGMAADVPKLKETIVLEGVGHFLQLEKPKVVNDHILRYFKDFLLGEA